MNTSVIPISPSHFREVRQIDFKAFYLKNEFNPVQPVFMYSRQTVQPGGTGQYSEDDGAGELRRICSGFLPGLDYSCECDEDSKLPGRQYFASDRTVRMTIPVCCT